MTRTHTHTHMTHMHTILTHIHTSKKKNDRKSGDAVYVVQMMAENCNDDTMICGTVNVAVNPQIRSNCTQIINSNCNHLNYSGKSPAFSSSHCNNNKQPTQIATHISNYKYNQNNKQQSIIKKK